MKLQTRILANKNWLQQKDPKKNKNLDVDILDSETIWNICNKFHYSELL